MANLPISGLTAGVAIADADLFADVQSPTIGPMKVTASQIKTYVGTGLSLTSPIVVGGVIGFGSWTAVFPANAGAPGQVLTTNGAGTLSWANGAGTVTSVDVSGGLTGLTFSGGPVTNAGTITAGGVLNVANGGTGAVDRQAAMFNILPPIGPQTQSYCLFNDGVDTYYWAANGSGGAGLNSITVDVTRIGNGTTGSIAFNNSSNKYGENNLNLFWDNTNYRLGIGTNTPSNALTVANYDALINGVTVGIGAGGVLSNTAVGASALAANAAGVQNTAVGSAALSSNTGGLCNTATGYAAASLITTGNFNSAFGSNALSSNVTGDFNTALGSDALRFSTVAGNTAVGCSALAANTTGTANTAIGVNALTSNVTGTDNVAVGDNALSLNTNSLNTAVGSSALAANISGFRNTAVGNQALAVNVGADSNTAVGDSSLAANTNGTGNTAVGRNSLASNLVGINNVAVGFEALLSNTVSYNIAIGAGALAGNTVGTPNVAVGNTALNVNTTGSGHVAVGDAALKNNTTGQQNTAIGAATLETNTIGQSNVAVGANALRANLLGNGNTGIGFSALSQATGSNNIALGNNSGSSITTGSNNVIIGNYVGTSAPINTSGSGYIVLADGNGNVRFFIDANNNTVTQTAALATNAINGFLYIPTLAGTPTGTPTPQIGTAPIAVDTTNNKFYFFSSGAWRTATTGLTTLTVNTTTITGGTSGRLVFDNAGTFGEAANISTNGAATLTVGNPLGGSAGLVGIVSSTAKTVSLAAATTTVANYTLTLPPTVGTSGQTLTSDGLGGTSWQDPAYLSGYTVGTLPPGVIGQRVYVTDALGPSFLAPLVGGGAVVSPAFFDGAQWVAG